MIQSFMYQKKRLVEFDVSKLKSVNSLKKNNSRLWVVINNPVPRDIEVLKETFNLHPTTAEDLLSSTTRIKYEEFEDNTFLVFKGVKDISNNRVHFYDIFIVDGNRYIITLYYGRNDTIENLVNNPKKIGALLKKGEDYIVHHIFDREVDKYVEIKADLSEELKKIEEAIIEKPNKDILQRLFVKEAIILDIKQSADSITDVCSRLTKPTENFIQNALLPYFRDIYDHALRVSEALKAFLDRIDSVRDSYLSLTSNRMNETMRVLTILMALIMPMTVITGFYGMNILLPIQRNPNAWVVLSVFMLIVVILMLLFFKEKGWVRLEGK